MGSFRQHIACKAEIQERRQHIKAFNADRLFLYGAGFYAREMLGFFNHLGVSVDGFLVDDQYLNDHSFCHLPVRGLSSLPIFSEPFRVVVAYVGAPEDDIANVRFFQNPNLISVEVIDCRFWRDFPALDSSFMDDWGDRLREVYEAFSDDLSRETFCAYINAKLLVDPLCLKGFFRPDQYFPSDLPGFTPLEQDVFVDAGAFSGDTFCEVVRRTDGHGCQQYHAFEPDPSNAEKLRQIVREAGQENVSVYDCGLWEESGTLFFSGDEGSRSQIREDGDVSVQVRALDQIDISATFFKLDIEGAELSALKGAADTLNRFGPRVAVAVYHKMSDLHSIPDFLLNGDLEYQIALRLHSHYSEELVLYATVKDAAQPIGLS